MQIIEREYEQGIYYYCGVIIGFVAPYIRVNFEISRTRRHMHILGICEMQMHVLIIYTFKEPCEHRQTLNVRHYTTFGLGTVEHLETVHT